MFAMREHLARIMPTKISARKTPYKVMALILTHRGGRAQALRRANSLLAVLNRVFNVCDCPAPYNCSSLV